MLLKEYFEIDKKKVYVVFDVCEGEELTGFQKESYIFVENNIKKLYKQALKEIKKHIKTKEFRDVYIADYGITEKEIFDSICFRKIYFNKSESKGFGFLGGWEADIEHGLGVKFVRDGKRAKIVEIEGQDCLL